MVSIILYGMLITRSIGGLANLYGQIQRTAGATERLHILFSTEVEKISTGKKLLEVKGEIWFKNITFHYPNQSKVLQNLNLRIPAGKTIAITGESGAGKSTLIHLLIRFTTHQARFYNMRWNQYYGNLS